MKTHTLTVRDRAITWDEREVVQHGLNSDTIRVDADSEFANCDTLALILFNASNPRPMRYMVDETLTVRIPSVLMEQTGALSVCLIGYVGGAVRIVTKQERMPLVVVKSGETGGIDPDDGNPDLWGQLLAAEAARVEAEHGREAAEALRVAAETARVEAERGREAAENKRQQDTSTAIGNANKATSAANDAALAAASAASDAEQKGNAAQEIADNIKAAAERGDFNGAPGAPGDKGDPGNDGTSPTASVRRTDTGAVITVTDANGTTTAEVMDGTDGETVIPDLGVTNVKIADNAVNSRTIADGSVTRTKLAQDALVKAGAGISIADDGTAAVDMDGLRNMMQVTNWRIGVPVDGVSTGSVYYSFTPLMMVILSKDPITARKPADATSDYVKFMRLDTDMPFKHATSRIDVAFAKDKSGVDRFIGFSTDTNGTVWLEIYLYDTDSVEFDAGAFSNIIIPLCGGGRS